MQLKKELSDRIHLQKNVEQLYEGKMQTTKAQLEAAAKKNEEYGKMVKYLQRKLSIEKDNVNKVCYFSSPPTEICTPALQKKIGSNVFLSIVPRCVF